ncbi:Hypothetical protein NTJ_14406 [Nesidiocoris tenuis]|uniref:Invertebrate defensins family profile domain-containing protein n=1 Tax=Nesidiocoris tenuis TaxID=355587 RepID=A0ABN7BB19_9HEMI|nr:Hypothetical protein NTJ_14406 [Nesidiocoris tenuis]
MKSSLIFGAAALVLVVAFSSESNASALPPVQDETSQAAVADEEIQYYSPEYHIRETRDLRSCNVGGFACNLHCQFQGYESGKCVRGTCKCNNYSG